MRRDESSGTVDVSFDSGFARVSRRFARPRDTFSTMGRPETDKVRRRRDRPPPAGRQCCTTFLFSIETVFHVNVDFGTGALISAQAALIWPSVVPDDPIRFPLTHIGNTSVSWGGTLVALPWFSYDPVSSPPRWILSTT